MRFSGIGKGPVVPRQPAERHGVTPKVAPKVAAEVATKVSAEVGGNRDKAVPPLSDLAKADVVIPGTTAPDWASADTFRELAKKASQSGQPSGGNALTLRLQRHADNVAKTRTVNPATREKGRSLLQRAKQHLTVVGGKPVGAEELKALGTAVHLTRADNVDGILKDGLRPSTSALVNWSTWFRDAVYMFPAPPKKGGLEDHILRAQEMTQVIEIDLSKLDPDKLFRRTLDGALVYLSDKPIDPAALRHKGRLA